MMNFHPIQDQRLSDRIAQQFTQAMQSGELTVGTRLPPEAQLADPAGRKPGGFCARRSPFWRRGAT